MKRWAFRWVGHGVFHDRERKDAQQLVDVFVPVELDAEAEQEHQPESEGEKPMTNKAAGPFTAGKAGSMDGEMAGAGVFDVEGKLFAFVSDDMAIGGHLGAKARATRIAESLNKTEGYMVNLKQLVRAGREMQRWRGGAGAKARFNHEIQLDEALEPFADLVAEEDR